ncbi:LADA_0A07822g1_1 [Lachancea dasiensis]|uniref:alpha-1,2-Mannosidase n=1 Tax=Lachancea dasiensis TaxID=1072105 RepID=A0A1G4IQL0_9SACH|nr:LADA_0A07822g1_1 [Lachancea dasiensis]
MLIVKSLIGLVTAVATYRMFFASQENSAEYRRNQIESVFLQSWRDYCKHGWDADVYKPVSKEKSNMYGSTDKPLGWIIVDSIDSILIMYNSSTANKAQFEEEFLRVEEWVTTKLDYDIDVHVSLFETTIRMLGGLLSAYHLSKEMNIGNSSVFLEKAIDLADRMMPAFDNTPTGIPYSSINLHTGASERNHADNGASSTAEFTTLQLEFKYLSIITGDTKYWSAVEKVYRPLYESNRLLGHYGGLAPIYVYPDNAKFRGNNIRLGSRGDSFYEYLLKQYLQTRETLYYVLYRASMEGVKQHLVSKSHPSNLVYIGEKEYGLRGPLSPKMDHLVCFMGGLLAMGATEGLHISDARQQPFWSTQRDEDWALAQDLTYTCYQMYHQIPSGLAPEIVVFNDQSQRKSGTRQWWKSSNGDFYVKPADAHNLQRPETVESIMFLYHLTKDQKYRDWGWEIFKSFRKHSSLSCKSSDHDCAYTCMGNVLADPPTIADSVESFWFAETLKYLHLLFQDDVDLTKVVFNTEAHPFPVVKSLNLRN